MSLQKHDTTFKKSVSTAHLCFLSKSPLNFIIRFIELARHLLDGAENFDTRAWLAAVAIVMTTLLILTVGTCCVLYRDSYSTLCK